MVILGCGSGPGSLSGRRQQAWSGARSRRAATSPWSIAGTSTGTWLWSCAKSVKRQRGWSLARIRTGLCKTSWAKSRSSAV